MVLNNINVAHTHPQDGHHQITLLVSADCYQRDVVLAMNHLASTIGPSHYRRSDAADPQLASPMIQEFGWTVPESSRGAALALIKKLQRTDVISADAFQERARWDASLKHAVTQLDL